MNGEGSTGKLAIADWLNVAAAGGEFGEELQCCCAAGCQGDEEARPRPRKEKEEKSLIFSRQVGKVPGGRDPTARVKSRSSIDGCKGSSLGGRLRSKVAASGPSLKGKLTSF
jgi:hypothetical protein